MDKEVKMTELKPEEILSLSKYISGVILSTEGDGIEFVNLSIPLLTKGVQEIKKSIKELTGIDDKQAEMATRQMLASLMSISFMYLYNFSFSSLMCKTSADGNIIKKSSERIQSIIDNMDCLNAKVEKGSLN